MKYVVLRGQDEKMRRGGKKRIRRGGVTPAWLAWLKAGQTLTPTRRLEWSSTTAELIVLANRLLYEQFHKSKMDVAEFRRKKTLSTRVIGSIRDGIGLEIRVVPRHGWKTERITVH